MNAWSSLTLITPDLTFIVILYYFKLGFFPFQNRMLVGERASSVFPKVQTEAPYKIYQFIVSTMQEVRAVPKYASEPLRHVLSSISRTLNSLLTLSPLLYSDFMSIYYKNTVFIHKSHGLLY